MGARPRHAPRQRVKAVTDRDLHELMPGWMELHLIDAVAEAVVRVQLRRILIGLEAPADRLLGPGQVPEIGDQVLRPRGALSLHRLAQRPVGFEEVVVDERGRLVQGLVVDADSTSSVIITLTVGQAWKPSRLRPARCAPSSSGSRSAEVCSGEKNTGSQPSAISPASATFLGPIAAR